MINIETEDTKGNKLKVEVTEYKTLKDAVKVIKELQKEITELKKQVEILKNGTSD